MMLIKKIYIIFSFLMILLCSCEDAKDFSELRDENLTFSELPSIVRNVFTENLLPYEENGTMISGMSRNTIVNLDSPKVQFSYEITGEHGFYPGKIHFTINGNMYSCAWHSEPKFKSPFILHENSIYCRMGISNIRNQEDLSTINFAKFYLD